MLPNVGQIYRQEKQNCLCVGRYRSSFKNSEIRLGKNIYRNVENVVIGASFDSQKEQHNFSLNISQKISSISSVITREELLTANNCYLRILGNMNLKEPLTFTKTLFEEAFLIFKANASRQTLLSITAFISAFPEGLVCQTGLSLDSLRKSNFLVRNESD